MNTKDELLISLYKTYSKSGEEGPMRDFLFSELSNKTKYGDLLLEEDTTGNIYITKGKITQDLKYPCAVAHMDQVQLKGITNVMVIDKQYIGWDFKSKSQEGLGADDKNGIWCVLKLLQEFEYMKAAFFVKEEIGCLGSNASDISFFNDVRYILQADRKGSSDAIFNACGIDIASENFVKDVSKIGENYKYKSAKGSSTDVKTLVTKNVGVSCMNISCGYYNPHTNLEYTLYDELTNCLNFMRDIFKNLTKCYLYKYEAPVYNNNYGYYENGIYKYGKKPQFFTKDTNVSENITNKNINQQQQNTTNSFYSTITQFDKDKLSQLKQLLKIINEKFNTIDDINLKDLYEEYNFKFNRLTLSDFMSLIIFSCFGLEEKMICK